MKSKKYFTYQIELANLLFLKLILLKSIGFNLNKYLKIIANKKNFNNFNILKTILKFLENGIETKYILKYISNKLNIPEIKVLLTDYEINGKIDKEMISILLEKNKKILENITDKLNFYYIILTTILYLLPIVLIVISFFLNIDLFLIIIFPIILSILIINKLKKII